MGVGGRHLALAAVSPGNRPRYSLYRRLAGPRGPPILARKIVPLPGFET